MSTTPAGIVLRHVRALVAAEGGQPSDRQLLERFTAGREQAAFEALVRRHGPLVLGVCRRVLHNRHDAEDAFQATFLVLARKAASAGRQGSLGGWLYRVAYHAAARVRDREASRQRHERRAAPPVPADPLAEVTGRELLTVLDEELQRLPQRLRLPLVLCYLESHTGDEAARRLGWSVRTFKRRLAEAREGLRARLRRRGLTLPAALLAGGLVHGAAGATVSAGLVAAAVQAASSPRVAVSELAEGVMRAVSTSRLNAAAALALTVALVTAGIGATLRQAPAQHQAAETKPAPAAADEQPRPDPKPDEAAGTKPVIVTGRIVGPDDKPVAGAQVATIVYFPRRFNRTEPEVRGRAEADGEGRYRLVVPDMPLDEKYFLHLKAAAKGYGLGAQFFESGEARDGVTIRVFRECPVRVRLIDIQGAPAAGVKAQVHLPNYGANPDGSPWPGPVTTDAEGRVTLRGLSEGMPAVLEIRDDRFVRQRLRVEARPRKPDQETVLTLAPLRVVEGVVAAADTGHPLANARVVIQALEDGLGQAVGEVEGRTDDQGRYRIIPYNGNQLITRVYSAEGSPYLPWREDGKWSGAAVTRTANFALPRGVLVRGRVVEAGSGKPVAGAHVVVQPRRRDNPFYRRQVVELFEQFNEARSDSAGAFQIAVLPGPGHLLVKGPTPDFLHVETSRGGLEAGKPGGQRYYPDGLVAFDHKPGATPAAITVTLRRGVTVKGRVVRPDGKPVADCVWMTRTFIPFGHAFSHNIYPVEDGGFELPGRDPERSDPVFFLDAEKQLGAVAELSGKQAADGPATVRLAPCGAARVRFMDQDGKPWANQPLRDGSLFVHLHLVVTPGATTWAMPDTEHLQSDAAMMVNLDNQRYRQLRTDAEGRVIFPTLIPGATFHLMTGEGLGTVKAEFTAKAGQTVELADVVVKRRQE